MPSDTNRLAKCPLCGGEMTLDASSGTDFKTGTAHADARYTCGECLTTISTRTDSGLGEVDASRRLTYRIGELRANLGRVWDAEG